MIPPIRFPGRPLDTVLDQAERVAAQEGYPDKALLDAARRELRHLERIAEAGLRLAHDIVEKAKQ